MSADKLAANMSALLHALAEEIRPCQACGTVLYFVRGRAGQRWPLDIYGTNHFKTCTKPASFGTKAARPETNPGKEETHKQAGLFENAPTAPAAPTPINERGSRIAGRTTTHYFCSVCQTPGVYDHLADARETSIAGNIWIHHRNCSPNCTAKAADIRTGPAGAQLSDLVGEPLDERARR